MTKQEHFFSAQPWWLNFFKILSVDFTICWWHLCKFFKNHKSTKSLNIPFHHYQVFSKSTRGHQRLYKEQYTIKVCVCVCVCATGKPV